MSRMIYVAIVMSMREAQATMQDMSCKTLLTNKVQAEPNHTRGHSIGSRYTSWGRDTWKVSSWPFWKILDAKWWSVQQEPRHARGLQEVCMGIRTDERESRENTQGSIWFCMTFFWEVVAWNLETMLSYSDMKLLSKLCFAGVHFWWVPMDTSCETTWGKTSRGLLMKSLQIGQQSKSDQTKPSFHWTTKSASKCCTIMIISAVAEIHCQPKFMPISLFRRVSHVWGASGHLAPQ